MSDKFAFFMKSAKSVSTSVLKPMSVYMENESLNSDASFKSLTLSGSTPTFLNLFLNVSKFALFLSFFTNDKTELP